MKMECVACNGETNVVASWLEPSRGQIGATNHRRKRKLPRRLIIDIGTTYLNVAAEVMRWILLNLAISAFFSPHSGIDGWFMKGLPPTDARNSDCAGMSA